MAALAGNGAATGNACSGFNAASKTAIAAARRRRSSFSNNSIDDDEAGVSRQVLRESQQAVWRAPEKAEAAEPATVIDTKLARKKRRLLTWAELAPWQQPGSERILTGYREASGSIYACLHSWTYLHNESVNILSHVAGAIFFAGLSVALWLNIWPWAPPPSAFGGHETANNTTADRLAATAFMVGVAVCFCLSALFHTLMCHSESCAARGMAIDITGVLVLMAGAVVPLVHFGLACEAAVVRQAFYAATAFLGTLAAATTGQASHVTPPVRSSPLPTRNGRLRAVFRLASVQGPANGHRRAALFCGFAAVSCAGPIVWMQQTDPLDWSARINLWPGVLGTLLCNTAAFAAYTTQFPERWWPRRFDLVGASHQIMHVAVLAAAVAYTVGVHQALAFRRGEGGGVSEWVGG